MSEPSDRLPDDAPDASAAADERPAAEAAAVDRDDPTSAADTVEDDDGRPPVVVDRGRIDGLPAVVVDGPSEAYPHPAADRCPYCLTFIGLNAARRRGVRFCPLCGADWQTIGRAIDAPSGAVIPFGEYEPPLDEADEEDHPTAQYTRRAEPVRTAPPVAAPPPAPAEVVAPPPSPWVMLATGLLIGLGGTLGVVMWYRQRPPPAPVTVAAAPVARPVEAPPPVVAPPVVAPPVETPPPVELAPPVEPPPPVEAAPMVSSEEVQAALLDRAALLPPSELVDITARVEGDIVFLDGRVGSGETLGQVVAAVAAVPGVRAVDSRGVQPAARLHAVAGGDTLAKLARLYYGDANAWPRIYDANREVIDRPDRLVPGMKLKIPRAEQP